MITAQLAWSSQPQQSANGKIEAGLLLGAISIDRLAGLAALAQVEWIAGEQQQHLL